MIAEATMILDMDLKIRYLKPPMVTIVSLGISGLYVEHVLKSKYKITLEDELCVLDSQIESFSKLEHTLTVVTPQMDDNQSQMKYIDDLLHVFNNISRWCCSCLVPVNTLNLISNQIHVTVGRKRHEIIYTNGDTVQWAVSLWFLQQSTNFVQELEKKFPGTKFQINPGEKEILFTTSPHIISNIQEFCEVFSGKIGQPYYYGERRPSMKDNFGHHYSDQESVRSLSYSVTRQDTLKSIEASMGMNTFLRTKSKLFNEFKKQMKESDIEISLTEGGLCVEPTSAEFFVIEFIKSQYEHLVIKYCNIDSESLNRLLIDNGISEHITIFRQDDGYHIVGIKDSVDRLKHQIYKVTGESGNNQRIPVEYDERDAVPQLKLHNTTCTEFDTDVAMAETPNELRKYLLMENPHHLPHHSRKQEELDKGLNVEISSKRMALKVETSRELDKVAEVECVPKCFELSKLETSQILDEASKVTTSRKQGEASQIEASRYRDEASTVEFSRESDILEKPTPLDKGVKLPAEFVDLFANKPTLLQLIKDKFSIQLMVPTSDRLMIFPSTEATRLQTILPAFVSEMFVNLHVEQNIESCLIHKIRLESLVNNLKLFDQVLIRSTDGSLSILGEKNAIIKVINNDLLEPSPKSIFDSKAIDISSYANIISWVNEGNKLDALFDDQNVIVSLKEDTMFVTGSVAGVIGALINFRDFTQKLCSQVLKPGTSVYLSNGIDPRFVRLFQHNMDILQMVQSELREQGYQKKLNFKSNGQLNNKMNPRQFSSLQKAISVILDHKIFQYEGLLKLPDGWWEYVDFLSGQVLIEEEDNKMHIFGLKEVVKEVFLNLNPSMVDEKHSSECDVDDISRNDAGQSSKFGKHTPVPFVALVSESKHIQYATLRLQRSQIPLRILIGDPCRELVGHKLMLMISNLPRNIKYSSSKQVGVNTHFNSLVTILKSTGCLLVYIKQATKLEKELTALFNRRNPYDAISVVWRYNTSSDLHLISTALKILINKFSESFRINVIIPKHAVNCSTTNDLDECLQYGTLEYGGGGTYFRLIRGLIEEQTVNIIVNSTYSRLDLTQDLISSSILNKAGNKIQEECNKLYKKGIKPGEIAITGGGKTKCTHIFHVTLPNYDSKKSLKNIATIVKNCLVKATEMQAVNIAFPPLGIGNHGYPTRLVAKCMLTEIDQFIKSSSSSLQHVLIVNKSERINGIFIEENLARILKYF